MEIRTYCTHIVHIGIAAKCKNDIFCALCDTSVEVGMKLLNGITDGIRNQFAYSDNYMKPYNSCNSVLFEFGILM